MFNTVQALPREQILLAIKEPNPPRQCERENIVSTFCTKTGTFLMKLCVPQQVGTVECDGELTYVCITLHTIH